MELMITTIIHSNLLTGKVSKRQIKVKKTICTSTKIYIFLHFLRLQESFASVNFVGLLFRDLFESGDFLMYYVTCEGVI